ncbi:DNA-binding protein [Fodinibius sp. SL11]|uniref:DNA-binding protein n=1 Tax=Fodinibius sp. SL11 TaxID=3425690 RepID=UPI003F882CC4
MNTQDVIKKVQQVGGGIALLSAAGVVYSVARRLNHRRGYERPFDPKKMIEVKGEVLEVSNSKEVKDEKHGVHLILDTKEEQIPVHLGPLWYISRQPHHFKSGDKIKVKGSRVTFKDSEIIVASEIREEKMQMILRDEKGNPVWQSWRKVS